MKFFSPSFLALVFLSYLGNLGMIEVCQHFLIYFLIHRALEDSYLVTALYEGLAVVPAADV